MCSRFWLGANGSVKTGLFILSWTADFLVGVGWNRSLLGFLTAENKDCEATFLIYIQILSWVTPFPVSGWFIIELPWYWVIWELGITQATYLFKAGLSPAHILKVGRPLGESQILFQLSGTMQGCNPLHAGEPHSTYFHIGSSWGNEIWVSHRIPSPCWFGCWSPVSLLCP